MLAKGRDNFSYWHTESVFGKRAWLNRQLERACLGAGGSMCGFPAMLQPLGKSFPRGGMKNRMGERFLQSLVSKCFVNLMLLFG